LLLSFSFILPPLRENLRTNYFARECTVKNPDGTAILQTYVPAPPLQPPVNADVVEVITFDTVI